MRRQSPLPVRQVIRTERPGGSAFVQLFRPMVRRTSGGHCGWPHGALPQFTHRRVTAVLTFLREPGLRG